MGHESWTDPSIHALRLQIYGQAHLGSHASCGFIRGELAPMRELAAAFLGDVEKCPGPPEAASAHRVVGLTR
jgi:hypothetical protein